MPNTPPSSLPSSIPQGTPSAPAQTPPSFGAQLLGNKEFSVELNDAVFETEAWRSSRYKGHQLEASKINKFTEGDKTFGKTPIVEKYSRNIYIGNAIIGYDNDPTDFNPTPGFQKKSFITFEGFFTVNSDDTTTDQRVIFKDENEKKGFDRAFREDFKIGSKCSIQLLDKGVDQKLKDSYTVDFNEGLLSRVLEYSSSIDETSNKISWRGRSVEGPGDAFSQTIDTGILPTDLSSAVSIKLFNNRENKFYTDISGSGLNIITGSDMPNSFISYFNSTIEEAQKDLANNKFFIEFKSADTDSRSVSPYSFNIASYGLDSVNVFELSLSGVSSTSFGESFTTLTFRVKSNSRFSNPLALPSTEDEGGGPITTTNHFQLIGSSNDSNTPANNVILHRLNPRQPAILINLIKEEEIPQSTGNQNFVVIPENFDPSLRNQLNKILKDKFGFDIEGGFSTQNDINPYQNRFLGRRF